MLCLGRRSTISNRFEAEIAESAKVQGLYYQRLPLPQAGSIKLTTNPYDSFLVHQGKFIPLELKSQEEHGRFDLSRVRTHQVEGLKKAIEHGCKAYLLVNMRGRSISFGSDAGALRKKKWQSDLVAWAFDFSRWVELREWLDSRYGPNRKSVPLADFSGEGSHFFQEIPRVSLKVNGRSKRIWDVSTILGS